MSKACLCVSFPNNLRKSMCLQATFSKERPRILKDQTYKCCLAKTKHFHQQMNLADLAQAGLRPYYK